MFGIFADVFKRATYQDNHPTTRQDDEALHRQMRGDWRPPFHWSYETRRRKGWRGDYDE